ncbi:hypothetical protein K503DRAFT_162521 [Rhizopogon vinicolor AM-OR11-026]|uniref:Uncharacterized protein n=1 Tax=Rhizopogon vinicolor AM-OR11-026 TaxID=1314800 RepID=A0A1B7ME24_9AGAM|nr:hypothetical protein K503DRAFT_162521 [Rhizopogon vinicolor AM-OR11-026]
MLRDVYPGAGTPVDYQEAFLMMREMLFIPPHHVVPLHTTTMPSNPLWVHLLVYCLVISPRSSVAFNPTPVTQLHCSNSQDKMSPLVVALPSSKLQQHKTDRHCTFLGDLNNLATRGKQHSNSSKANHKAKLRHRHRKLHLLLHRRLPHLPRLIVLLPAVRQRHSHNLLPPARVRHGGLVWYFSSAVRLSTSTDNGVQHMGNAFHYVYPVLLCRQ